MALIILQVLVLGVLAAAADDVPVTWWAGSRAELPCIVPDPATDLSLRKPPPLHEDEPPKSRQWAWRRGATEINAKRISPNGTLEVHQKKEGVYQCSTPQHGGIVLGLPINLKFASIDKQFTKHPENVTVRARQPHAVSCEILSAPVATLSWLKNGHPLPEDARYHNLAHQLLILDVNKEDAGDYVCIAHNPYGQNRTSYSGTLQVEDRSEKLEPALLPLHHEEQLVVPRRSRVVLPCPIVGWPRPTLIWEHTPPGSRRSEIEDTSEVLVMPSIMLDQAGYYSCVVDGNSGLVKNFNVTVTTPVVIKEPPAKNRTLTEFVHRAGTARFNCTPSGQPTPVVTWYKDGVPLPSSKILYYQERLQLVIGGVTSEDAGIYQCVARSAGGVATAWAVLGVVGQAAAAPRGLACRALAAAAVRLTWSRAHDNETYVVHSAGNKLMTGMPHSNNEQVMSLSHALTPYKFQVRAFVSVPGSHTASDMSEEVICQGQGVPIKLVQMYGDTVMVSWEQFAASNPDVVEWILQYRNGTDRKNISFAGNIYNYTLHAPKSSPLHVRVLGSKSKVWTKQDLSLVPWVSTVDTEDDDRKSIPAPTNVVISKVEDHSFVVRWAGGERGEGGEGGAAGYVYEVCVRSMEGIDICENSYTNTLHIKNLEPETDYDIRVRVIDRAGSQTSEFSPPQHVTTLAEGGLGSTPQLGKLFYMFSESGQLRVWWAGERALYTVHYSNHLKLPIDGWHAINTTTNSVLITGLEPTQETFVMVIRHEPRIHSNILNVPPQINGPELHDLKYEYFPNEIRVSWSTPAVRFVKYSQNLTVPMENWTRVNATTENSLLLGNVNVSLPTYVSVSVSESQWYSVAILNIPPQPASQLLYLVTGLVVGVIVLLLMAATGVWLWRRRKQNQSPLGFRRRNTGNKSNEEDGSEMKNVGSRLANGGGSADAGEPLLNGHVHIIENPTSKTPNGKLKRGRVDAAFDVSRHDDHNTTLESVLDADTSASTTYNFLDTSRRPDYEVSKSSRDVSSNNSFNKLPDDNMNSELTRSIDFNLESSKIQPTLQPNG